MGNRTAKTRALGDPMGCTTAEVQRSATPYLLKPEEMGPAMGSTLPMLQGHLLVAAINVIVKLRVPDVIGSETLSCDAIADRIKVPGLDRVKLNRILRMVAGVGLLKELVGSDGKAQYRLTPGTALMQTELPQPSLACGVHHWTEKPVWDSALHLTEAVTGVLKGHPDAAVLGGKSIWDHWESEPANLANFAEFMSVFSFPEAPAAAGVMKEHYGAALAGKTVVDVGGSEGAVLKAIKAVEPAVKAINFDRPETIGVAPAAEGLEMVGGDFFKSSTVPKGDIYMMKHILHDWDDADSVKILKSIKEAAGAGGELVLMEAVIAPPGTEHPHGPAQKTLDTLMMCIGGKERSHGEWTELLADGGWKLDKVIGTPLPMCSLIFCSQA